MVYLPQVISIIAFLTIKIVEQDSVPFVHVIWYVPTSTISSTTLGVSTSACKKLYV